jgi:putative selenate reductase molybdopterin-binding subunit
VTGRAAFADDLALPGLLHARILRSPHDHARVASISATKALALPGVVTVLTHEDVPRRLHARSGRGGPEDALVLSSRVQFRGDRVAVVAAEDPEGAERGCRAIQVEYEVLPAVLDPEAAVAGGTLVHEDPEAAGIADRERNVATLFTAATGDVLAGLAEAEKVFEETYRIPALPVQTIEAQATLAYLDEEGRLVVRTPTAAPFRLRSFLSDALSIGVSRIRVVAPRLAGAFGAASDFGDEDLAALLAFRTRRPVRLERGHREDGAPLARTAAYVITVRTGVKDGRLTALDIRAVADTGAHGVHAAALARGFGDGLLSLYACPHTRLEARAVYTHRPPPGAPRGRGWPQGVFALESHMDEVARALGEDPYEFRNRNEAAPERGKAIATGARAVGWGRKRKRTPRTTVPGLGVAFVKGPREPGEGALATILMNEDGTFLLFAGPVSAEADTDALLRGRAARILDVEPTTVTTLSGDTDLPCFDPGGDPLCAASGRAVDEAARRLREAILGLGGTLLERAPRELLLREGRVVAKDGSSVELRDIARAAGGSVVETGRAAPGGDPRAGAVFVEVEVDRETGRVSVSRIVEAAESGSGDSARILETLLEGGALRGLEGAFESPHAPGSGRPLLAPRARDPLEIATLLGPSEGGVLPDWTGLAAAVAPAIAGAVFDAVGARVRELPLSPERVLLGMRPDP